MSFSALLNGSELDEKSLFGEAYKLWGANNQKFTANPAGFKEELTAASTLFGFLQGAGGAHFVIAQPDAETTAFSVATSTAALTAATRITPTAFGLPPLLLGVAVGITHGPLAWNQAQV